MKFFNQFARIFGFKININNIIEEEKNKFEIFANKTKEKHRAWKDKKELIKNTFEDVVDRSNNLLIKLYMCETTNQIQLFFGKNKLESSIYENATLIENGSALVFSKACNGIVHHEGRKSACRRSNYKRRKKCGSGNFSGGDHDR